MTKYIAILIDGDNECSLGGGCSRDLWNITRKLINDLPIDKTDIHSFFHNRNNDIYAARMFQMGISNINDNALNTIKICFDKVIEQSKITKDETVIFFHYSGHGYQVPDNTGDEISGMDDIFLGHTMRDDFIWDNFITKLPETAYVIGFMDACHSGTGMDMPYEWKNEQWVLAKKNNIEAKCKGFSLSACSDSQCASQDIGETTGFAGSLTAGICDCCKLSDIIHNPFVLYNKLVPRLRMLGQTVILESVKN